MTRACRSRRARRAPPPDGCHLVHKSVSDMVRSGIDTRHLVHKCVNEMLQIKLSLEDPRAAVPTRRPARLAATRRCDLFNER